MIITIDGPAGAGKSHVARALAQRLGFRFLDTGAMYRAVALAALRRGLDWNDQASLARLAQGLKIRLTGERVLLDGEDVTDEIRDSSVTEATRYVADHQEVRGHLVHLQQVIAGAADTITEGRDQGTVAFPHADCKFYLTASAQERARRRWRDLRERGESISLEEVLTQLDERDRRDAARPVGRLSPADDAIHVCTDALTVEQVVDRLEQMVREKALGSSSSRDPGSR